jgi:diaminohydroxyphosphoribosylaminopyrimidine deaminase/5-amino-6-(5-phosphoribosylamino)uracil reductase
MFTHNISSNVPVVEKVALQKDLPSSIQIADYLYTIGIQSLFIEGGADVLNHFIRTDLWDEARVFTGLEFFNDGIKAPVAGGNLFSKTKFSLSTLEIYLKNGR